MSEELPDRLRRDLLKLANTGIALNLLEWAAISANIQEAAATIASLQAELARAREALEWIAYVQLCPTARAALSQE